MSNESEKSEGSRRKWSIFEASTEVVISTLPLVVVLLVMIYIDKPAKVFAKPEWAFGAAIFFGQAVVKLLSAMANPHKVVQGPKVVLFAACILVFGLVPTLLTLVFIIHGAELPAGVPFGFQVLQTVLFLASAFVYVIVGVVTEELAK